MMLAVKISDDIVRSVDAAKCEIHGYPDASFVLYRANEEATRLIDQYCDFSHLRLRDQSAVRLRVIEDLESYWTSLRDIRISPANPYIQQPSGNTASQGYITCPNHTNGQYSQVLTPNPNQTYNQDTRVANVLFLIPVR